MMLPEQISKSLAAMRGFSSPEAQSVEWSDDQGLAVAIDFKGVDSLSCAFEELRVSANALRAAPLESLQAWADCLCQRVTYLLETLGPLELDAPAQTVLIRSNPPTKEASRTSYYEMLVRAPGVVGLRRYVREADAIRQALDILITHEVLLRLVRDIVDAVPAVATNG